MSGRAIARSLTALMSLSGIVHGQDIGIRGMQLGELRVDWRTPQIARVIGLSNALEPGQIVTLDGKRCLEGGSFYFDVDDRYAFDIDETVQLEVEFYEHVRQARAEVAYERNGSAEAKKSGRIYAYRSGPHAYKQTFVLDRARFANRSLFGTDFSIAKDLVGDPNNEDPKITICDVKLTRTYATAIPKQFGGIALEVFDEIGRGVPARVGIYDAADRLPLPSDEAIAIKRAQESFWVVNLTPSLIPWPVGNPSGFYINRSYHAKLPVGKYVLVVAKGPEYRIERRNFNVEEGQVSAVKIKLRRWSDLPAKGWYSGDTHIHYVRHDQGDDPNLSIFTQAEDLHVANILQAGNIAYAHWPQYGWTPIISSSDPTYSLVPGQEDPRTSRRGHAISLHLKEPIRDPQHYLLYDRVFEKARAQGGVTGYAHVVGVGRANAIGGLALDVPMGLVDFVEVLQFGMGGSSVWFDFLNLGYRLAPTAGTDYMTDFTLPGAERTYVQVPKPFSLEGWFGALKRGEVFVTNGPMLEFTVNGKGMGSQLALKSGEKITIDATAAINPDIDSLESLELIEQGEVIKTVEAKEAGDEKLQLHHEITARHGTWFVIRARGKRPFEAPPIPELDTRQGSAKIALSGAIYVYVDGQGFWKPSIVPTIVQRLRRGMEQLMEPDMGVRGEEYWETRDAALRSWSSQKGPLKQRVDRVMPIYDRLVARAAEGGLQP